MTEINLGDFKLRFDPNDVRVSIDGDVIDVGARINNEQKIVDLGNGIFMDLENRRRFVKTPKSQDKSTAQSKKSHSE